MYECMYLTSFTCSRFTPSYLSLCLNVLLAGQSRTSTRQVLFPLVSFIVTTHRNNTFTCKSSLTQLTFVPKAIDFKSRLLWSEYELRGRRRARECLVQGTVDLYSYLYRVRTFQGTRNQNGTAVVRPNSQLITLR
jgi:hypothetical protein